MSTTPTSYQAYAIRGAIDALANCASWQAACSVATAAEARARIARFDGGRSATGTFVNSDGASVSLTGPIALAHGTPPRREHDGLGSWKRSGRVTLVIGLPITAGDNPPDVFERATNITDGICDELEVTSPSRLRVVLITGEEPALGDPTGPFRDRVVTILNLDWSA